MDNGILEDSGNNHAIHVWKFFRRPDRPDLGILRQCPILIMRAWADLKRWCDRPQGWEPVSFWVQEPRGQADWVQVWWRSSLAQNQNKCITAKWQKMEFPAVWRPRTKLSQLYERTQSVKIQVGDFSDWRRSMGRVPRGTGTQTFLISGQLFCPGSILGDGG